MPVVATELRISPHRFPGVFEGEHKGRATLWTRSLKSEQDLAASKHDPYPPRSRKVTIQSKDSETSFAEWAPQDCLISAGLLSGLYHFPVQPGSHLYVHCAPSLSVARMAEIIGWTGRISAVSSRHNMTLIESKELVDRYPNLRFANCDIPFTDQVLVFVRLIIPALLGISRSAGDSFSRNPTVECVFHTIRSFLDPNCLIPQVSCAICYHPPHIRPVTRETLAHYEQHVVYTLGQFCNSLSGIQSSSLWITLIVRLDSTWAAGDEDNVDMLCERIFDLLASCCGGRGSLKPKEQLLLDPSFQGDCVILVGRYRRNK